MPHKPSPAQSRNVTFVSVSLTVELKAELAEFASTVDGVDLLDLVEHTAMAGYRLGLKEDAQGFTANMSMLRENGPNKGIILQEWGSTPKRALLRLLWAHYEHFKLIWPADRSKVDDDW